MQLRWAKRLCTKITQLQPLGDGSDLIWKLFKHFLNKKFILQVPISWEEVNVEPIVLPSGKTTVPPAVIKSINQNKVGLKGIPNAQ